MSPNYILSFMASSSKRVSQDGDFHRTSVDM